MVKKRNDSGDTGRRRFLALSAFAAIGAIFPKTNRSRERDLRNSSDERGPGLIIFSTTLLEDPHEADEAQQKELENRLVVYDVAKNTVSQIKLPILYSHACLGNPADQSKLVILPKHGTSACTADILEQRVVAEVTTNPGYKFSGHGVFTRDGRYLLTSENLPETNQGIISIRRSEDLKKIDSFPSHGFGPHDLKLLADNNTLVVCNNGFEKGQSRKDRSSSLSFIDPKNGKLFDNILFKESDGSPHHLHITPADVVIVLSHLSSYEVTAWNQGLRHKSHYPSPLFVVRQGNSTLRQGTWFKAYPDILNANLAVNEDTGIVGCTHRQGNTVSFWDLKNGDLIKSHGISAGSPKGVCLTQDKKHFVITTSEGHLYFFSSQTLDLDPEHQQIISNAPVYQSDKTFTRHVISWPNVA